MSLPPDLRRVEASNAGPFTLGGTRTHIVGLRRVAVIDPGPDLEAHMVAVASAVVGAESVVLLLTHGHADHAGAAAGLSARLGAPVLGAWGNPGGSEEAGVTVPPPDVPFRALDDGEAVPTDAGALIALSTPGHAREHLVFHWPERGIVFTGDLVLGSGETTWVGGYPGCVADYLASLERVGALEAELLVPAHGPPVSDPSAHIALYRQHRLERVEQIRRALADHPDAGPEELFPLVYGESVPESVVPAARASLAALVEHVRNRRR